MHHVSSTLATLVLREAARERLSEPIRGCPKEFEGSVYRELAELHRTRPRLVVFAPTEALKRILAFPVVRRCLGSHAERQPIPSRLTVTARRMATKISLGFLATTLLATVAFPAVAAKPELGPPSKRYGQQEQEISAAGKRKGGKSKVVKRTVSNAASIAVPAEDAVDDFGPADPYPSLIDVAGFKKAKITDVNLTLRGFSHEFPGDVQLLLVAPGGRNAVVMGDVDSNDAGAEEVTDLTVTLDDEAANLLPNDEPLTNGSFQPGDADGPGIGGEITAFPAPAPEPSGNNALSTFDGINPNGRWQLFILDDDDFDFGALSNGWTLEITAKSKVKNKGKRKH